MATEDKNQQDANLAEPSQLVENIETNHATSSASPIEPSLTVSANEQEISEVLAEMESYLLNSQSLYLQNTYKTIKNLEEIGELVIVAGNTSDNNLEYVDFYFERENGIKISYLVIEPNNFLFSESTTEERAIILAEKVNTISTLLIAGDGYSPGSDERKSVEAAQWIALTRFVLKPLDESGELQSPKLKMLAGSDIDVPLDTWRRSLPELMLPGLSSE